MKIMANNSLSNKKKTYLCIRKPNVKQRSFGRLMGSVCSDDHKMNKQNPPKRYMEILLYTLMILLGVVIYYFEYTPVPDNVSKKDFWRYGVGNGIIGTSFIIAGVVNLFCEDHIYSYIDKLNGFWCAMVIIASLGVCFLLPWMVRILKKRSVGRTRNENSK